MARSCLQSHPHYCTGTGSPSPPRSSSPGSSPPPHLRVLSCCGLARRRPGHPPPTPSRSRCRHGQTGTQASAGDPAVAVPWSLRARHCCVIERERELAMTYRAMHGHCCLITSRCGPRPALLQLSMPMHLAQHLWA